MPVTIEVSNLTKDFGEIAAVSDLSFKARSGEIIALLGPNGAGKSHADEHDNRISGSYFRQH